MARKATTVKTPAAPAIAKAVSSTPVRNSPIPKVAAKPAATPKVVTNEMIAVRAYEISQSPRCGSDVDNWCQAERELRGM
jgi:hypothetical protein